MALLIDGYNLLHVTDIFGEGSDQTALHRSRQALLSFLTAAIDSKERAQTTIVFDAAGAPPGLPRTLQHEGITVQFARGYADADAMIEDLLEQHAAPRSLLVVSSDHRVQRAARRRGAKSIDSALWYSELLAARRAAGTLHPDAPAKPVGTPTPDEVAYWLDQFDDPRAEEDPKRGARTPNKDRKLPDDLSNPFPPDYGEDLLDEKRERRDW